MCDCSQKSVDLGRCSDAEIGKYYDEWFESKHSDVEPNLGEDWVNEAYSAKVQLASLAFVEPDPDFELVGHGNKKDENCGANWMRPKTKKLQGCLREHLHNVKTLDGVNYSGKVVVKPVPYNCNRPSCPCCYIPWAVREAKRAEQRLKRIQDLMSVKFEHGIVSPPQDFKGTYEELCKYVLKAVLRRGFEGGLYIYHHFRYHGANESFEGERAHYFKGRHFHFMAYLKGGYGSCRTCSNCWRDKKDNVHLVDPDKCVKDCNGFEGVTRRAYEKDGCIVKIKGPRKTLGGSVYYELSHASLRRGVKKQTVVNWWGSCGRNKLKIPKGSMPQQENLCEICHQPLYDIEYLGNYADLLAFMGAYKRGKTFILDAKDKDGNWLWRAVVGKG